MITIELNVLEKGIFIEYLPFGFDSSDHRFVDSFDTHGDLPVRVEIKSLESVHTLQEHLLERMRILSRAQQHPDHLQLLFGIMLKLTRAAKQHSKEGEL